MFPAIGPKRRPISENTVAAALQLAHRDKNKIRGIYNRAERLKERTRMMQEWFDHLDALRIGDNVLAITKPAKVGELLRAIDSFNLAATRRPPRRCSLAPRVFLRPG